MMKKCFLHSGYPKTATTAIQRFLFTNRRRLRATHDLFYLPINQHHNHVLRTLFLDDPRREIRIKMSGVTDRAEAERIRAETASEVDRLIRGTTCSKLALSSEGVIHLSHDELSRLRDWLAGIADEVEVAIALRDPFEWSRSAIQQNLKTGGTLDAMVRNTVIPRYWKVIPRIRKVFGAQNVKLFQYRRPDAPRDSVVCQILKWMTVDEAEILEFLETDTPRNESMSHFAALLMDSLNRQRPLFVDGKISDDRTAHDLGHFMRIGGRERFFLTPDQAEIVREAVAPDLDWLRENTEFDWTSAADPAPTPQLGYDRATIDSLALVISDLINARRKE